VGKKSRDKGARGERQAADLLRPLFPNVRRRAMQARGGRVEGADLENTGGWHVEVGVGRVNPRTKWEQARHDSQGGEATPIALTKADLEPWLVTMPAETWLAMLRLIP